MKKIGILALVLVVTLGAVGVGYAMWSDTLTVQTNIATGSVDVVIENQKSNDPPPHGNPIDGGWFEPSLDPADSHQPIGPGFWTLGDFSDPATWEYHGTRYEKNVASTDCEIVGDTITITIDNGYPSYGPDVLFDVLAQGTVPVKLLSAKLVSVTTPAGTFAKNINVDSPNAYAVKNDGTVDTFLFPLPIGWNDDAYAFTIVLSSIAGIPWDHVQLEPGDRLIGDVGVHVAQSAIMSSRYAFTIELVFAQYNEVP